MDYASRVPTSHQPQTEQPHRKEVSEELGVEAAATPKPKHVCGGKGQQKQKGSSSTEGKKRKRRRKPKMAPGEIQAFRQDFAGALLNTALHMKIGKSRRDAMITEMAASMQNAQLVRNPDHISEEDIETVKATFDLYHFLRHYYRKGREYWALLGEEEGQRIPVTCLEIKPAEKCMTVLDRDNQEHEIFFNNKEEVEYRVEDVEQREIRKLHAELARQEGELHRLKGRLDSVLKQVEVTEHKINREHRKRARVVERLMELQKAYDDRRHKFSRTVGPVTREELVRAAPVWNDNSRRLDQGITQTQR